MLRIYILTYKNCCLACAYLHSLRHIYHWQIIPPQSRKRINVLKFQLCKEIIPTQLKEVKNEFLETLQKNKKHDVSFISQKFRKNSFSKKKILKSNKLMFMFLILSFVVY